MRQSIHHCCRPQVSPASNGEDSDAHDGAQDNADKEFDPLGSASRPSCCILINVTVTTDECAAQPATSTSSDDAPTDRQQDEVTTTRTDAPDTAGQVLDMDVDADADLQQALLLSMQDSFPQEQHQHGQHHGQRRAEVVKQAARAAGLVDMTDQNSALDNTDKTNDDSNTKPKKRAPATKQPSKRRRVKQLPSKQQLEQVYRTLLRAPDVHGLVGRSHIAYAAQQLELHLTGDELDAMIERVQDVTGGARQLTFDSFCALSHEVL